MKKLTLLMMACCIALFAYAQPWTITYVLPQGAVTNDYGWQSKDDMFWDFAHEQRPEGFAWLTLAEYKEMEDPWTSPHLGAGFNSVSILGTSARWAWLGDYIRDFQNAWVEAGNVNPGGGVALLASEYGTAQWRIAVSAFWVERMLQQFPRSADFRIAGTVAAFQSAWGGGFDGPATIDSIPVAPIVLPAPFMEDMFFLGWFTAPDGGGTRMNVIPAGWQGSNMTLYAHFGPDPIYTPADLVREVAAGNVAVGDEVKSIGVVTFVAGNTIYLQAAADGSAMTVSFAALPADVTVGRELMVEGTVTAVGSLIVLTDAIVEANDVGTLPTPTEISLPLLDANRFRLVEVLGVTVTAVSGTNVTVQDGMDNVATIVATLPTGIGVGNRISVVGVVSYDGTTTRLIASDVTATLAGLPDPFNYPDIVKENATFSFEGMWLISNRMGNYLPNRIAAAQASRGMAARDGRMYFVDRVFSDIGVPDENHGVVVVNAATGDRIERINFRDTDVFRNTETGVPMGSSFNDLQLDCAGNFVSISLAAGSVSPMQIWVLDMETPANSRMLLDGTIAQELEKVFLDVFDARIDYFDVFGDMNGDGFIMAAGGNSPNVFRWTVEDGEITWLNVIGLEFAGTMIGVTALSTAAYIYIVNEDLFFIDTQNEAPLVSGVPILFDMLGQVVDGFHNIEDLEVREAVQPHARPVGLTEFTVEVDDDEFHFLILAHGNTDSSPASTFQLLKYADAGKEFESLTPMWVFPGYGLGGGSNPGRSAIPSVTVDGNVATIHVWYVDIGYGVFEFTITPRTSVPHVSDDTLVGMFVEGNRVIFDQEVSQVSVFNVTGQLVKTGISSTEIEIPATGVFLVRVVTLDGQTAVDRVIIR